MGGSYFVNRAVIVTQRLAHRQMIDRWHRRGRRNIVDPVRARVVEVYDDAYVCGAQTVLAKGALLVCGRWPLIRFRGSHAEAQLPPVRAR